MVKEIDVDITAGISTTSLEEKIQKDRIRNPSMLGKVNVTRLIKDWNEIAMAFKANLSYPLKQQRIYSYLVEDMQGLPLDAFQENPYIDLPCGLRLNVVIFKGNFDEGVKDLKEQVRSKRKDEKPEQIQIEDMIEALGFPEKATTLMKYQFKFVFNKAKLTDPHLRKSQIEFVANGEFVIMKIKGQQVSRLNTAIFEDGDDLLCL